MTNLDIIKQKMHKVNDEWIRVRNEMYELRKQEIEEQKEILKKHIGRCIRICKTGSIGFIWTKI